MPEFVSLRHPKTQEEKEVTKTSAAFFVSQGYVALDAAGRVKAKQPAPASDTNKE